MVRKPTHDELAAQELALIGSSLRKTLQRHADILSPSARNWLAQVANVLDDIAASTTTLHEGPVLQWIDSFVIDGVILDNGDPQRTQLEEERRRLVIALNDDGQRDEPTQAKDADALCDRLLGVLRRTNWRDLPHHDVIAQARVATLLLQGQLDLLDEQGDWTDTDPAERPHTDKRHVNPEAVPGCSPDLRSIHHL